MKFDTGGLRRHGIIYSLDTGRLMGGPFDDGYGAWMHDCKDNSNTAPLIQSI